MLFRSAFIQANAAFAAANNVAPQIQPAFNKANAAYTAANLSTNYIVGTSGTVAAPTSGVISFTSNNGITVVATSANNIAISDPQDIRTTASPTFAGMTLTSPLPITSGGTGTTSAGSALTALLPTGTTSGYVLTTGGPGNFYWAAGSGGGGGGTTPGTTISSSYQLYTANGAGQAYIPPVYVAGTDQLKVYLDGVRQNPGQYTETSGNTSGNGIVTFASTVPSGVTVLLEVDGYIINPYYANNIAYTINSGIGSTANTIQLAIDGLVGKVSTYYANVAASPSFTTVATGITVPTSTSNTAFATTAYVQNLTNNSGTLTTNITGSASSITGTRSEEHTSELQSH